MNPDSLSDTTYLLVGHGSRGPDGNRETYAFARAWQARHPDWRIETCFIEHAEVLLDAGLDAAARHARRVVVVPCILNAAGHVKMEMPEAVARARARHPAVDFRLARHLGMGRELLAILTERLQTEMQAMAMPDPRTTGVVLLGRGSSDAGANGELAKMARWLFEAHAHELVDLAFTGVTWPRLESVVQRQVRLGMMQVVILPVYLFTGVLIERIKAQVARLARQYPTVHFALAEHFGFAEGIFRLVDQRVAELEAGEAMLECDGCKYRAQAAAEARHDHAHHAHAHPAPTHAHPA